MGNKELLIEKNGNLLVGVVVWIGEGVSILELLNQYGGLGV